MEYIPASSLLDLLQGAQIVWVTTDDKGMTLQFKDGRLFHLIGEFAMALESPKERMH